MRNYFIKTPNFIRRLFPNLIWSFSSSKKKIFLTFDDGPTPEITGWTLNTLKKFNAKATFFCIGKNVKNHPTIFNKIRTEGHTIGNHTHNHLNGWKTSVEDYLNNVSNAEKVISAHFASAQHKSLNHQIPNSNPDIQQTTNNSQQTTKLFRPPYGKIKRKQSKAFIKSDYKIIMWNVLSADFDKTISPEKCLENVLKNVQNGSIIIFHDSVKAEKNMKYALPKVLEHFSKEGFEFKAIY